MKNMTAKETIVFAAIVNDCQDYSSSVKQVASTTGMDIATVKGVVGSLVSKFFVQAETDKRGNVVFKDLWPLFKGEPLCFGGESMGEEAWNAYQEYMNTK